MIDMMYVEHKLTRCEYNVSFKVLQAFLRKCFPSHQLRKDTWDRGAFVTNGLAKFGFQEIRLRSNLWGYRSIEIRLRPQLLINNNGYYSLTKLIEFESVNQSFNYVLQDVIALNVPGFFKWNVKRVEPAIDLKVEERLIEKYLLLFKKGNIPDYFLHNKQTIEYWDSENNVYLVATNKAVNWYNRYSTLLEKERKARKMYKDFSETKGILRFETQVRNCNELVCDVLNMQKLKKEVMWFYLTIVGKEDFYNLEKGLGIINQKVANLEKRMALRNILILLDKYGCINKAKIHYVRGKDCKKAADNFSKRLNQIRKLGVNPIVLPKEWEMDKLENLYPRIKESFTLDDAVSIEVHMFNEEN